MNGPRLISYWDHKFDFWSLLAVIAFVVYLTAGKLDALDARITKLEQAAKKTP